MLFGFWEEKVEEPITRVENLCLAGFLRALEKDTNWGLEPKTNWVFKEMCVGKLKFPRL